MNIYDNRINILNVKQGELRMKKNLIFKSSLVVVVWLISLVIGSVFVQNVFQERLENALFSDYIQMIVLYLFVIVMILMITKLLKQDSLIKEIKVINFRIGLMGVLSILICFGGDIFLLFEFIKTLFEKKELGTIILAEPYLFIMSMIAYFLVGFSEELCFRGIVLKMWINQDREKNRSWIKPTLVISIVFGLVHLVNLSNGLHFANIIYTLAQVLFASMYGVIFSGIMRKTNSVLCCGLIHGTINLLGNSAELIVPFNIMNIIPKVIMDQHSVLSGLITIIVVIPGFLWGIHVCKNKNTIGALYESDNEARA